MRRAVVALVVTMLANSLSGCAVFEDILSFDNDGAQKAAASAAEQQSLMELSISNGRYSVMLGQAREILQLPEPKVSGADTASVAAGEGAEERALLAKQQVQVANEFLADTARACQRRRVAKGVRSIACAQQKKVPAELRSPVAPEVPQLSGRNDKIGEFVMEWWDAVCATAPKPRPGEPSACSIE